MTEELVTLETAELLKEKGFLGRKYIIDVSHFATLLHIFIRSSAIRCTKVAA
jgi:hypothetical protein